MIYQWLLEIEFDIKGLRLIGKVADASIESLVGSTPLTRCGKLAGNKLLVTINGTWSLLAENYKSHKAQNERVILNYGRFGKERAISSYEFFWILLNIWLFKLLNLANFQPKKIN